MERQLKKLYKKDWEKRMEFVMQNKGLSFPLLISPPDGYFKQRKKLMIIGQQTLGWGDKLKNGSIDELLDEYAGFDFGRNYFSSPFWNITRKVEITLGIEPYQIVWSNINRCDFNNERPSEEMEFQLIKIFPLLKKEISILKPDIIIFFVGPSFDNLLNIIFDDCNLTPIKGFNDRFVSKVSSKYLPSQSYRTYHPNYLRRSKQEDKFIKFIKRECS